MPDPNELSVADPEPMPVPGPTGLVVESVALSNLVLLSGPEPIEFSSIICFFFVVVVVEVE